MSENIIRYCPFRLLTRNDTELKDSRCDTIFHFSIEYKSFFILYINFIEIIQSENFYSQVPNKRPPPLVNFSKIFQPPRTLLGPSRLLILTKVLEVQWKSPLTFSNCPAFSYILPLFLCFL